jgi:hypothetical protein
MTTFVSAVPSLSRQPIVHSGQLPPAALHLLFFFILTDNRTNEREKKTASKSSHLLLAWPFLRGPPQKKKREKTALQERISPNHIYFQHRLVR